MASLIAFLSLVLRVPVQQIQAYLCTLYQMRISTGEIVELLHQVCLTLKGEVDAERSIRLLVVIRKISGGSRSPEDTTTHMVLASLFETWRAHGLNPFDACY